MGENIGMRNAGFDRDLLEGVAQNIAEGALGGGISGAGGPVAGAPVTMAKAAKYAFSDKGREAAKATKPVFEKMQNIMQQAAENQEKEPVSEKM